MLRFLAAALACAASVYGSETEESVRKSVPASSATHLRLNAEFGSINVQPGTAKSVDVEVHFRGDPPSRREFDRMLHDFSLKVEQQGSEVTVYATFIARLGTTAVLHLRQSALLTPSDLPQLAVPRVFELARGSGVSHHRSPAVRRQRLDVGRLDFREPTQRRSDRPHIWRIAPIRSHRGPGKRQHLRGRDHARGRYRQRRRAYIRWLHPHHRYRRRRGRLHQRRIDLD